MIYPADPDARAWPQGAPQRAIAPLLNPDNLHRARIERARRHLRYFAEEAWPVLEPGRKFVPNWHIDAICEHLEAVTHGQITRLIINIPPRHMKSLLVAVFWMVWEWLQKPSTRWLAASYAQALATRDNLKCRRLIRSPWFQENFGDRYTLTSDQFAKIRFENNHTGYRIATSPGGTGTGEGGDRVLVDDPHKAGEAQSKLKRESVLGWFDEEMSTRLNDPESGAIVVIMQRLHEADVTGHALAQDVGYEHLMLPARYEPKRRCVTSIGFADPRTRAGELLWPARVGERSLAKLERILGPYGTAGQLQQAPAPAGGAIFKGDSFKFYDRLPLDATDDIQSWDFTFKGEDDNDFVVGQVWCRAGADRYLIHQDKKQRDFVSTVNAVISMTRSFPRAARKLYEDKANGPAVRSVLARRIPGLIPVQPEGDKEARARAVTPECESGNVFLPNPYDAAGNPRPDRAWVLELIKSLTTFPNAEHDDDVDAFTQALRYYQQHAPLDVGEWAPSKK